MVIVRKLHEDAKPEHRCFVVTDGEREMVVHGEPDMSAETRAALIELMNAAYEMLEGVVDES